MSRINGDKSRVAVQKRHLAKLRAKLRVAKAASAETAKTAQTAKTAKAAAK